MYFLQALLNRNGSLFSCWTAIEVGFCLCGCWCYQGKSSQDTWTLDILWQRPFTTISQNLCHCQPPALCPSAADKKHQRWSVFSLDRSTVLFLEGLWCCPLTEQLKSVFLTSRTKPFWEKQWHEPACQQFWIQVVPGTIGKGTWWLLIWFLSMGITGKMIHKESRSIRITANDLSWLPQRTG